MAEAGAQRLNELVARYRAGEPVEEELYRTGYAYVWAIIRRRGWYLPGGELEDLVQEGMIGFMEALRDWKPGSTPFHKFAGLCIIRELAMVIRLANYAKRRLFHEALRLDAPIRRCEADWHPITVLDTLAASDRSPEDRLLDVEDQLDTHCLIEGLCQGLSQLEREALLRFTAGQAYRQIAQALGTTEKAIDNALQRARRKLMRRRVAMSA